MRYDQRMSEDLLARISMNPKVMLGKPVIRGTRITVEIILEKLSAGFSTQEILTDYPALSEEDVRAALAYARQVIGTEELIPQMVSAG